MILILKGQRYCLTGMSAMKHKALFLDRDGVINEAAPRGEYVCSVDGFCMRKGIVDLICRARKMGYLVVVVTNQRGVNLGRMSHDDLENIHAHMKNNLAQKGAVIDAVYACTHGLDDACDCRKPKPGMLLAAARDFNIDLASSIMIGDTPSDVEAGKSAGCHTHLLTI